MFRIIDDESIGMKLELQVLRHINIFEIFTIVCANFSNIVRHGLRLVWGPILRYELLSDQCKATSYDSEVFCTIARKNNIP